MSRIVDFIMLLIVCALAVFIIEPTTVTSLIVNAPAWLLELSKIISWPITALIFLYVFISRKDLFLDVIESIKVGGVEISFHKKIEKVERVRQKIDPKSSYETPSIPDALVQLAIISPANAIIETWREVEDNLRKKLPRETNYFSFKNFVTSLAIEKHITPNDYQLYLGLREVRNKLVHAAPGNSTVSYEDFLSYYQSAQTLIKILDKNPNGQ